MTSQAKRKSDPQDAVSFDVRSADRAIIHKIAARVFEISKDLGLHPRRKALEFEMDVTAVHANGNPLRLTDLLAADDFNFTHDVFGIERHLDRSTGALLNCFRPRFSVRSAA